MSTLFTLTSLFNLTQWTVFAVGPICNFSRRTDNTRITIAMWNLIKRTITTMAIYCNLMFWTICAGNSIRTWNLISWTLYTTTILCNMTFWTLHTVRLMRIGNFSRHSTRLTHTILSDLILLAGHAHHSIHCWNLSARTDFTNSSIFHILAW
jgi:hypothetical protein